VTKKPSHIPKSKKKDMLQPKFTLNQFRDVLSPDVITLTKPKDKKLAALHFFFVDTPFYTGSPSSATRLQSLLFSTDPHAHAAAFRMLGSNLKEFRIQLILAKHLYNHFALIKDLRTKIQAAGNRIYLDIHTQPSSSKHEIKLLLATNTGVIQNISRQVAHIIQCSCNKNDSLTYSTSHSCPASAITTQLQRYLRYPTITCCTI
jgi:hypothetical protein